MVILRQVVDSPAAFTPAPYGLLDVAVSPNLAGSHWQNGITFQDICVVGGGTTFEECFAVTGTGSPPAPSAKADNVDMMTRGATAFTVYAEFDCSPVGTIDDALRIGATALAQSESWQVERAFWSGQAGGRQVVWPRLAASTQQLDEFGVVLQTAATVPVTGSMDIAHGLGVLEQALGDCYNGVGVIHVSRKALPTLWAWNLVSDRGGKLYTGNGNVVAVGAGYPGTGPAGQTPTEGQQYIYATGPVFALRSAVRTFPERESFDRAENTRKMIAERNYVLGWNCCHAAVLVDLGVPVT